MDGGNSFEFVQPSNIRCSGSWLYAINWIKSGNQKIPETCVLLWHYLRVLPLQQVLCVCQLWDGELLGKLYYSYSQPNVHVRPELMCLTCLYYSHFRKWKIWDWPLNWIRREIPLHLLLLACTLLQLNTLLWDISSWIWRVSRVIQNRVSDPLTRRDMWHLPWQKKNVYPIHSPELDEDDDDYKPLVRSDHAADSEDEDDKPLVQTSSRREPVKEKRKSAAERWTPAHSGETHRPHWTKMCQGIRVSDHDFGKKIQVVKLSAKSSIDCSMNEIWETLIWSIIKCPLLSSKSVRLIGTLQGRFKIFTSMWWRHAHSVIRQSRDLTDHAWADYEPKNLVILSSWIMVLQKLETKPRIADRFGWSYITFKSISM